MATKTRLRPPPAGGTVLKLPHTGSTAVTMAVNVRAVAERRAVGIGNPLANGVAVTRQTAAGDIFKTALVTVVVAAAGVALGTGILILPL